MIEFLQEAFSYGFMRNALLAGLLLSIASGVAGTLLVLNKLVFLSGGIAHASYGGVGLAYYFGLDPLMGALLFSLFSSMSMGIVQRRVKAQSDTLIGVMWAIGMAIGILFISLTPGYKNNMMSFLFGSILAVSRMDLLMMAVVAGLACLFTWAFYRPLLAISFDETFADVRNVAVETIYLLMLLIIGLSVVVAMRAVGLILVIAMLSIPPSIASLFLRDMRTIMLVSTVLSMSLSTAGLLISYASGLQSGPVIILLTALAYGLALGLKAILRTKPLSKA